MMLYEIGWVMNDVATSAALNNPAAGDTHVMAENGLSQQEINRLEWENPMNWGGPKGLAVYFSKRDSRIWVPQRKPSLGWTVNLAHTGGVLWFVGICVAVIFFLTLVTGWMFSDTLVKMLMM